MRKATLTILVLLLASGAWAANGVSIAPGQTTTMLNAVGSTGRGDCFSLTSDSHSRFANAFTFTVTTSGSPTGYTVLLEGSEKGDGSDAVTLGTITNATAQTIYVTTAIPKNVCVNLSALSGGTSPKVTAKVTPYSIDGSYPTQCTPVEGDATAAASSTNFAGCVVGDDYWTFRYNLYTKTIGTGQATLYVQCDDGIAVRYVLAQINLASQAGFGANLGSNGGSVTFRCHVTPQWSMDWTGAGGAVAHYRISVKRD